MKFSEECRKSAAEWWEGSFVHPFIKGIGDGSLPIDCFTYYVPQDSYYLSHFAKVQSFLAAYHGRFIHDELDGGSCKGNV